MTRDDCILDVFRKALEQFLTNTVIKQQNEIFNKILGNTTPRIYHTTRSYCDECNVRNLRLLHSQDQCFSQSHCLCQSKNRKRRPCPNGICDYMLEAIIDEHYYKSPNLKHTDFSRWTKSNGYWEIALCYMQNKSQSAERASLSDLFNLVTNNRFVLRSPENDSCTTIIENEFREVTRKCTYACKLLQDNLQLTDIEAIITFLEYIQDDKCIQKLEEIWSGQKAKKTEPIFKYAGTLYDLENHVLEEFRKYARLQHKCSTAGTSVNQAADILRVHFKQNCVVDDKQENTCDAVKIIFGRTFKDDTCVAKNQEVDQPSDADKMTNIKPNTRNVEKGCGKVAAVKYTKDVDAAVIEITSRHPIKGLFIDCKENILRIAGLKEKPEYNDGSSAEPNTCVGKKIVKVGKESFLTVGMCVFYHNVVTLQRFDVEAVCPHTGKGQIVVMENQFSVRKWRNLPLDFCYLGDSGAGVFVINEGERLSCIGMLIGRLSDGTAIVTPIKRILDALSEELPELRLNVFDELTN